MTDTITITVDEFKALIARIVLGKPEFAKYLQGATPDEIVADAHAMKDTVAQRNKPKGDPLASALSRLDSVNAEKAARTLGF